MAIAGWLAACGGGGNSEGTAVGPIASRALRAGAPACHYEHVYVTVREIAVRQAEGDGWTQIALPGSQRIDLQNLHGAFLLRTLGVAGLAAGDYAELRLVLVANEDDSGRFFDWVQPAGGAPTALTVPGGAQSGIKVQGDFRVPAGQTGDVVLEDFDACAAIVQAGKSNPYLLKPELALQAHVVVISQEQRLPAGALMPLAGGGYALVRSEPPDIWHVQRYGTDGLAVGADTTIIASTQPGATNQGLTPLAGGGYVVSWFGVSPNPWLLWVADYPLYVQRFGSDGLASGPVQQVAVTQPYTLRILGSSPPRVVAWADGGFFVLWPQSEGNNFDVYLQRFAASGSPAGAPQQVSEGTGLAANIGLVPLSGGGYLVTWGTGPIYARAYGPDGAALAEAQQVGDMRQMFGDVPAVAALGGGGAVVAWVPLSGNASILARRVAPDGSPISDSVNVDGSTALAPGIPFQSAPSDAGLADGGYVVAWIAQGDVYARRFAADGSPLGEATQINYTTAASGFPGSTNVVVLGSGAFLVTWIGTGPDGIAATYARAFDANGLTGTP